MPKGVFRDEQDKRDAVAQFEGLGSTTTAAKQVATDFGVHYMTIQDWAKALKKSKKSGKPKRKVAKKRAVKTRLSVETNAREETELEALFDDFIAKRNAANEAKKKLQDYVERLR